MPAGVVMGFCLWFPSDPIPLCIRHVVGLFYFALYQVGIRNRAEGFEDQDGSGLLEIIRDHDVSLGVVEFPDVSAVWRHISSWYIGRLIPYFLSRPVGRVVSLPLVCFSAVYFVY